MADRLDDVARMMAEEENVPRRKALRALAGVVGGGLLGVFARQSPAAAAPPVKCPAGLVECGGACRDTAINPDHCGACGRTCPAGQLCRNGNCVACVCQPACDPALTRCGAVCVDTRTDPSHCGACGTACSSGFCVNGTCQACQAGQTACNGVCTSLASDVMNCGACGSVCPPPLDGVATCINGVCQSVCSGGTQICGSTCAPVGQSCNTGLPGICAPGTIRCVGTSVVCVQNEQPRPETCNGLDDDCDGIVDENISGMGQPCNTGRPSPCQTGTTVCVNGQVICQAPC